MKKADYLIPSEHAQVLVDPKAYADDRIHATHAWLRLNNPVGWAEPEGFDPFWVITRYDDVRSISRDNKRFPYGDKASLLQDKASDTLLRQISGGKPYLGRSLIQMDPPDHMKFRLLTQSWFMPKNLKAIEARIAEIADASVTGMMALGTSCDFVTDVALHYPLQVVMEILGVPQADLPLMLRLTQEIFAPLDPETTPQGVDLSDPAAFAQAFITVIGELDTYFKTISADRRANPRNDIASIIANAVIDGNPISDMDALGYYGIVATAGHDTTSSSTAAAMWAIASQPDLLPRLNADPSLIPALIDEAIRWATPVKTFMRTAAEDMDFDGRPFAAGDWIKLCYASGNRDEALFENADRFDIDRPRKDHVSFGYGPHVCLGQHLARLEMRILFKRLLPRLESVQLAGTAEMAQSYFVNGFKHLPIKFSRSSL